MEKTSTRPTFRHEWKHLITWEDMLTLRMRLKAVAKADIHTVDGRYHIRSLYFDNFGYGISTGSGVWHRVVYLSDL